MLGHRGCVGDNIFYLGFCLFLCLSLFSFIVCSLLLLYLLSKYSMLSYPACYLLHTTLNTHFWYLEYQKWCQPCAMPWSVAVQKATLQTVRVVYMVTVIQACCWHSFTLCHNARSDWWLIFTKGTHIPARTRQGSNIREAVRQHGCLSESHIQNKLLLKFTKARVQFIMHL